jgi:hypothetical protein
MKTSLTILAGVLALTARPVNAQDSLTTRRHPLLVNIKGGFSLTTYTGGGYIGRDTDLTTGYSGGLSGTVRLGTRIAVQVEAVYAGKGVQHDNYAYTYTGATPPSRPGKNVYEAALHYIDFPLLLSYGRGSGSRHGWFVVAGPQLSLAFDKQETVRPMGLSDADDYRETINGDAKSLTRWGTGYVAGVGYQTSGGGAGIEVRYSGDFSNVYRDGYGSGALYSGSGNRFHNGVIMLQVNLALRGGKWHRDWGNGGYSSPTPTLDPPAPAPRPRPQSFPRVEPAPSRRSVP